MGRRSSTFDASKGSPYTFFVLLLLLLLLCK
jgi:hypothetical protein